MNRLVTAGTIILSLILLSGCQKPETESIDSEMQSDDCFKIRLAQTKSQEIEAGRNWSVGDKVNVFHSVAGTENYICDGAFEYGTDGCFIGTPGSAITSENSYDWYISYPYDETMSSPKDMRINIPVHQIQICSGDTTHLTGSIRPLAGKSIGTSGDAVPTVSMTPLVTTMKITVTNYENSDCILESVSFQPEGCNHIKEIFEGESGHISGNFSVDFTGSTISYTEIDPDYDISISDWKPNNGLDEKVTDYNTGTATQTDAINYSRPYVTLTESPVLGLNESAVIYLTCLPFNMPNASILNIGMNDIHQGIGVRMCSELLCEAGKTISVAQGSRKAPPFKDGINFYHGKKNEDGSYTIDNDGWFRCDLPVGYDLQETFSFADLFFTVNADAEFTLTAKPNQNTSAQYYYEELSECLSGLTWAGDSTLTINLSSPIDDRSGIFVNAYIGYEIGNWPIFFRETETATETVIDTVSAMFNSYAGLVMAGYQGWQGTPGDGCSHNPGENWPHYCNVSMSPFVFEPGPLKNCIDFWPDVSEYPVTYKADGFLMPDGSIPRLYSAYDESTVNLHFKWMKDYGLDGVFMQRFVSQITSEQALDHSDKVLESAMRASNQYARAISIMYDMVGMGATTNATPEAVLADARELMERYELSDRTKSQRYYLYHNGKPLIGVVSVGQPGMPYGITEVKAVVEGLQEMGFSILLGVPTYWRYPGTADCINDNAITDLIKSVDIIMPWFVGRYDYDGTSGAYAGSFDDFTSSDGGNHIISDMNKCEEYGIDYCPLVFAGYSDKNQHPNNTIFDRHHGDFYWKQIYYNIAQGADMLYVAMFDEMDEGTAIFKCLRKNEVPSNTPSEDYYIVYDNGSYYRSGSYVSVSNGWCRLASQLNITFNGIENDLDSDYYLWLTGQAGAALKGNIPLTETKPIR